MTFHRGHWCPIAASTRGHWPKPRHTIALGWWPARCHHARSTKFAADLQGRGRWCSTRILTDIDNGYALSLNLAIWVGEEMQQILSAGGRKVPNTRATMTWVMPIPATFVIATDGTSRPASSIRTIGGG